MGSLSEEVRTEVLCGHICDLEAENAKLREFAKMMLLVCKSKGIVGGVFVRPDNNRNLDERVDFESLARELGIEVEE